MKNNFFSLMLVAVLVLSSCMPSPTPTLTPPTETVISPTPTPQGRTLLVTSPADSGPDTLRQALQEAQSGGTITFDPAIFPPDSPATIAVTSGLPELNQGNITIDASDAGVILDGSNITSPDPQRGFSISSNANIIRGLQITGFSDAGIGIYGGAQYNIIGGDRNVGDGQLGQGNLIGGNGNFGIGLWDEDTSHNTIQGNIIGINRDGTSTWGHARDGIHSNGATQNLITGNVIGGNESAGVYLCCVLDGRNTITNNLIGVGPSGSTLGNQLGILIDRTSHNVVGPANTIAHNIGDGISFWEDTPYNTVTQNSIHDNGGPGIVIMSASQSTLQPPLIINFNLQAGTVSGAACPNCTVEIFSDSDDEGAFYEGRAIADSGGVFTLTKGASFTGSHLTVSATDPDGNTSQFSFPTSGAHRTLSLQQENSPPLTLLSPKPSQELEDNHIGVDFEGYDRYNATEHVYMNGFKWIRIQSLTEFQFNADNELSTFTLDSFPPLVDDMITEYANNQINMVLNLGVGAGLHVTTTFKSEEEVDRLSNYARFVVSHFKDRIHYYEIWNEPNNHVAVNDYANLIRHVVPVIREEYPEARIVIGAFSGHWERDYPGYDDYDRSTFDLDYMLSVLRSGVAPYVDVISWHPFYDNIPSDPYYQNYAQTVEEIKQLATAQGFTGEYLAEELLWKTVTERGFAGGPPVSPLIAAKHYARAITLHRGLGTNVTINTFFQESAVSPIHNLNHTLAAAEPTNIALFIASEAVNLRQYAFSLPNGNKLVALWTNGELVEDDPGIPATLTFPGVSAQKVIGIDVLHGFEQELIIEMVNGDLVIRNFLIKDYPIILRLSN